MSDTPQPGPGAGLLFARAAESGIAAELMGRFYDGIWGQAHLVPSQALRRAQLDCLAEDRKRDRFRPSAWGAWVVVE